MSDYLQGICPKCGFEQKFEREPVGRTVECRYSPCRAPLVLNKGGEVEISNDSPQVEKRPSQSTISSDLSKQPARSEPDSWGHWKTLTLSLLVLFLFSIFIVGVYDLHSTSASESWPVTRGIVSTVSHEEQTRGGWGYVLPYTVLVPVLTYDYAVDGASYTSDRISFSDISTESRRDLNGFLSKYYVGMEVDIYYSPKDASKSVLIPGAYEESWFLMELLWCGVVLLMAIFVLYQIRESHRFST